MLNQKLYMKENGEVENIMKKNEFTILSFYQFKQVAKTLKLKNKKNYKKKINK